MERPIGTKARIVEHAMRLFWEHGYERTAISEIIAAAGVRSGSLYHFFATKEEVLVAVLEAYLAGLAPQVMDPAFAATQRSGRARYSPCSRATAGRSW